MKVSLLLLGNLLPDVVLLEGRGRRVWSDRIRTGRRGHICTRSERFLRNSSYATSWSSSSNFPTAFSTPVDLPRPFGARCGLGRAWTYGIVWIAWNKPFVIGWYRLAERNHDNRPEQLGGGRIEPAFAGWRTMFDIFCSGEFSTRLIIALFSCSSQCSKQRINSRNEDGPREQAGWLGKYCRRCIDLRQRNA